MKRSYIILILAVAVAALVWLIERPERPDVGDFSPFVMYPALDIKKVGRIEIEHLVNGIVLAKDGDDWKVSLLETGLGRQVEEKKGGEEGGGFPQFKADRSKVDTFLDQIGRLEAQLLVSTNPEKQATYQVNKLAKQVRVFDTSGEQLVDLYIGKEGPEMFTAYVRQGGRDEVYLVGEHIGAALPAEVMSWRDRRIWELDPAYIVGVDVTRLERGKEKAYSISKDDRGVWHLTAPVEAATDGAKVEELVDKVSKVSAARFAYMFDREETGLTRPSLRLGVTTTDGAKRVLIVGSKDKQGYLYARLDGDDSEIYLIDSDFGSRIPTDPATLIMD